MAKIFVGVGDGLGMGGHLAKMFVGVGDGLGMGSFGENVCRGGGWTRDGVIWRKCLSGWGMD